MKALLVLLIVGCVDSDPPPLPSCAELGAPDTLLCTRDGKCIFDGMACMRGEGSGSGSGSGSATP